MPSRQGITGGTIPCFSGRCSVKERRVPGGQPAKIVLAHERIVRLIIFLGVQVLMAF